MAYVLGYIITPCQTKFVFDIGQLKSLYHLKDTLIWNVMIEPSLGNPNDLYVICNPDIVKLAYSIISKGKLIIPPGDKIEHLADFLEQICGVNELIIKFINILRCDIIMDPFGNEFDLHTPEMENTIFDAGNIDYYKSYDKEESKIVSWKIYHHYKEKIKASDIFKNKHENDTDDKDLNVHKYIKNTVIYNSKISDPRYLLPSLVFSHKDIVEVITDTKIKKGYGIKLILKVGDDPYETMINMMDNHINSMCGSLDKFLLKGNRVIIHTKRINKN